jgi:thiamine pyrophosphokinase
VAEDIVTAEGPVLLLGGGDPDGSERILATVLGEHAMIDAPVVAADGGAALARAVGLVPRAVIGDFDSLSDVDRAALDPATLHHIPEQETTDFDKALGAIRAPVILGFGFVGGRLDHELAALSGLTRQPGRRCVLVGPEDVTCLCPPEIALDLAPGTRLSLYPLAEVRGTSDGLQWPIEGLTFRSDGRIGTSNRVTGPVRLSVEAPAMLLILPRLCLGPLLTALANSDAQWPVPAE